MKVPQSKWRDFTRKCMIACTTALLILTVLLFTLSNPGASGGPMTERVLSGQFQIIGFLMAVAYATPLVLSCAYPMYGEACCKTLKDEEVPDSEENVQETRKVDYVVLVIAILHWGVIFLGIERMTAMSAMTGTTCSRPRI